MTARVLPSLQFIQVLEALLSGGHPVRFRAPGWSMHPTIRNGDAITVAPLARSPVRVGDVVLYRSGAAAIAHRVIRVQPPSGQSVGLLLRGDAARACDCPVEVAQILGRVVSVERDGHRVHLDRMGPVWSRFLGYVIRVLRDARTKSASIVNRLSHNDT